MSEPLWHRSASELAALIRSREVSSREVVTAHLERIEAVNPAVNAVTVTLAERAVDAADAADRCDPLGPLHGVPFTVKENIDVAGSATTQGVTALADAVSAVDSPTVSRMQAAGAIVMARTNMPELGLRIDTANPLRGRTLNPWDPSRTAGGSSGGEGAALATGMSPFGLGNDIGGSLRNPALCNGIAALKPTRGRVPRVLSLEPVDPMLSGQIMAVEGPMARSIADLRLGLSILAGRHIGDPVSVDAPLRGEPSDRTAALVVEVPGVSLAARHVDAVNRAGDALRQAGWEVVEATPPELELVNDLWAMLMIADVAASAPLLEELLSPPVASMLGAFTTSPATTRVDPAFMHAERSRLTRAWSRFFTEHSVVVGPIWTGEILGHDDDIDPASGLQTVFDQIRFITPGNLLGLPATAVPTGDRDGLPTGVQIYADLWREDLSLDAAEAVEAAMGAITPIEPRTADR